MDLDKLKLEMAYNIAKLLLQKGTVAEIKAWLKLSKSFRRRRKM